MKERAKRFGLQEKLKKSNIGQDKDLYSRFAPTLTSMNFFF